MYRIHLSAIFVPMVNKARRILPYVFELSLIHISKDDLKQLVTSLRERSDGRPIGIKIAAGHIEADLEWIAYAQPDFITIDGRGGATGASPKYLKDNSTVPTVYALARARAYMNQHHMTCLLYTSRCV